ncbi:G-patch domain protein, putative [Talaromyces stipitatus ATCC 10500]|uniref:G-patch domain protein, putative n=1 Tax=Talaromyces stipitatus (strain ATCC 10500 / CBS 375.48 / QM 6759 / NRRL 1006) TaxID=441959 RepID=B8M1P8_TALSN|nr:G-patch domain protein, putative [Talaromyces stipitatus ATCC 10500]EED22135.1 G-patch domain protein, putative [Talaromyces stipitatus ATCC 10500]
MAQPNYDDEDYFVPLEDQRIFGAGIKRKRVPFVRASDDLHATTTTAPLNNKSARSVADIYSAIVLSKKHKKDTNNENIQEKTPVAESEDDVPTAPIATTSKTTINSQQTTETQQDTLTIAKGYMCEICNLPVTQTTENNNDSDAVEATSIKPHEASMVHQICLQHSHPPSHLDRTRHGLRYLTSYGWDPDSRTGLGVEGRTGILQPIKPKAKANTSGLGLTAEDENAIATRNNLRKQQQEQRQRLNAKQVRQGQLVDKKKGEKLRELFYASDDIQRYLGEQSSGFL